MKLKIYALVDNCSSGNCYAEHGLSYFIEYDSQVLFDTGQSDLFLKNAKILGIDINNIKTVVLSHGHYDHGNGLKYLSNKDLICHPDVFLKRYSGKQMKPVGLNQTEQEIRSKFNVIASKDPYWISDTMVFLGEIPRKIGFERTTTSFYVANKKDDLLLDDSAIVIKMDKGLFIISGCAHSGICNIIEHAKTVTNTNVVYGIIGGFHLKYDNKQTQQTIEYIKALNPQVIMPSHCTELPALSAFYKEFKCKQIKSGTLYTYNAAE